MSEKINLLEITGTIDSAATEPFTKEFLLHRLRNVCTQEQVEQLILNGEFVNGWGEYIRIHEVDDDYPFST